MRLISLIIILLSIIPCSCKKESDKIKDNIFKDEKIKAIYSLQDKRDSSGLLTYFKDKDLLYRKYAALSFASVQDKAVVNELLLLLSDSDPGVRLAAAYALGQTGDIASESGLIERFSKEESGNIKMAILESLGKCGSDKALGFLNNPALSGGDTSIMKGQALGIYRLVLRKKHSATGLKTVINTLLKSDSMDVRFYASNVLSRIREVELTKYFEDIRDLIGKENEKNIRMNLILALGKCKGQEVIDLLRKLLESEKDQRVVANIIRALGKFEFDLVKDDLLKMVMNRSYQIAVAASEVLLNIRSGKWQSNYLELARKTENWRAGSNLMRLSLRFAPDKGEISSRIKGYYKKSIDPYERGALLMALSEDPSNYPFVEEEVFTSVEKVVATSGMISISEMLSIKEFDPEKIVSGGKGSSTQRRIFADIFKRGIVSGDISLMAIASSALIDPRHKFIEVITDLTFLEELLNKYQLPSDFEKKREIKKTLNYLLGIKNGTEEISGEKKLLDWEKIVKIPVDQKVKIVTDEGDIVIKLFVNDSPGSVSNFLDLISDGYLGSGAFHRVVPNFVIQDGCPRGDGWGGPDKTIRSEFSRLYYEEGSIGMASSGKDTEGSQWFITHSSTPHLDGRYTIFGKVISGMEIVQKIRVGTRIIRYKIL